MVLPVECPLCGETVEGAEIDRSPKDPDPPVARRQTAFDGTVSSLVAMDSFAYVVEMPCCDRELVTVN